MRLDSLPTPCLILDRSVLNRNLSRMQARAADLGVALRPHLKTAKSAEVATAAVDPDACKITVSTLAEARYFAGHGFDDITYAVGITPDKLPAVAALQQAGCRLGLILDDPATARMVAEQADSLGENFGFYVEIDSGGDRAGLAPQSAELIETARILVASPRTDLLGVLTHAGHSYACESIDAIKRVAAAERDAVVTAATRLRQAELPCPVVSVGSTPTACVAEDLTGVTEMRPGVYTFMDLYQAKLGVCDEADIAVTVLASVIGRRPAQDRLLVDAGALALAQDASLPGFGRVQGHSDMQITGVNQEHGIITCTAGTGDNRWRVGDHVRILPNHACMTAAMHERYHVVDGSDDVVAVWERCNHW